MQNSVQAAASVLGVSVDELFDIFSAERPADRAYVNVGLDDIAGPGRSRSDQPLAPGDAVLLWVEIGPRSPNAVAGDVEPIDPELLAVGQELEVVLFTDAGLSLEPAPAVGRVVVAATESFPVVNGMLRTLGDSDSLLEHRLYARVQVPSMPGTWRVQCAVFLKGVLVHVQELTLPVGTGEAPSDRTTFRLLSQFQAPDRFESLRAPSLTVYANNSETSHNFCFYLPNGDKPALTKQVELSPANIVTLTDAARNALRAVSWGDTSNGAGKASKFPQQADGTFGPADDAGRGLVELAVAGANLWLAFANRMEPNQPFHGELRERMAGIGTVQLGIKDSPDLIVPLQLLYDRKLDTSQPQFLHLCAPSAAWLTAPAGDLPCLAQPCPSLLEKDPDLHVCIAGFWGIRHAITLNLAHRPCNLVSEVPTPTPPPATIATCTDPDVKGRWTKHEQKLRSLLAFVPAVSTTSTDVFASVDRDASVLVYFLAHVEYNNGVPRIVMDNLQPRGAINASTIESAQLHLCAHQPVVFMNACASAAMTPTRMLGLVDAWVRAAPAARWERRSWSSSTWRSPSPSGCSPRTRPGQLSARHSGRQGWSFSGCTTRSASHTWDSVSTICGSKRRARQPPSPGRHDPALNVRPGVARQRAYRGKTRNCWCCGTRSPCCAGLIRGPGSTGPTAQSSPR